MSASSELHPAGEAHPVGCFRATSRWIVQHSRLTTLLVVLLVGAWCLGQWWVSYHQAQDWEAGHPGQPVPSRLLDAVGWTLISGAAAWLWLWYLTSKESGT